MATRNHEATPIPENNGHWLDLEHGEWFVPNEVADHSTDPDTLFEFPVIRQEE